MWGFSDAVNSFVDLGSFSQLILAAPCRYEFVLDSCIMAQWRTGRKAAVDILSVIEYYFITYKRCHDYYPRKAPLDIIRLLAPVLSLFSLPSV